jgi:signal peptidase I
MVEQHRGDGSSGDDFVSSLAKSKSLLIRYLYTHWYFWRAPAYLLSDTNAKKRIANSHGASPLPPLQTLALTLFIASAAEAIIFPADGYFELPPRFEVLHRLLNVIPGGMTLLLFAITSLIATIPYALAKAFGDKIPFRPVLQAYCYQQSVLLVSLILISYAPILLNPTLAFRHWMLWMPWLEFSIAMTAMYWLMRQLKNEGLSRSTVFWLGFIFVGFLMGYVRASDIYPIKLFNIVSRSMEPTLRDGDLVAVNRWAYWWRLPRRGELVVFHLPAPSTIVYPKRIVGLPGDRVQMKGGQLYINGQSVRRDRVDDFAEDDFDGPNGDGLRPIKQWQETLPNGATYRVIDLIDGGFADDTQEYHVPKNSYFVLGDNRDNSTDSRFAQVGPVPLTKMVGPIYRRLLPANHPLSDK